MRIQIIKKRRWIWMAKMKYWNGKAWEVLDAKNADTLDGKHASDFQEKIIKDESKNTKYKLIVKNGRPYLQVVSV